MSKKVLIVDDSTTMRQMVAYTLRQAGYEVVEGTNGQEGLDRAIAQACELVITDLNMPVMDGLALVRALRTQSAYRFTPILMLTTESDGNKKLEGKTAGATGWIVKPFDPEKLLATAAKFLK